MKFSLLMFFIFICEKKREKKKKKEKKVKKANKKAYSTHFF